MAESNQSKNAEIRRPVVRMLGTSRKGTFRRKIDPFLADPSVAIDYKNPAILRRFITDRGKILPRRITGVTAKNQRRVAKAIRRARMIALMPFSVTGK